VTRLDGVFPDLVAARELPTAPRPRPRRGARGKNLPAALRFRIARWSDNELILFDDAARESWILYPPRSRYAFVRRVIGDALVVEHRPWSPDRAAEEHVVRLADGCVRHGIACKAQDAIQAAVDAGFDPFR
jgi:hypothetical protein